MDNPNVRWTYDIGVLEVEKSKPFFKPEDLDLKIISKSFIRPICLAAENYNFNNEKMHGIGWGSIYEEWDKPYVSSCMTNEVSSKKWKFLACDMEEIKKNGYSCEKVKKPVSITRPDLEQCKKYFTSAEEEAKKAKQGNHMEENVHKIYVTKEGEDKEMVCYKEEYFKKVGWCKVDGAPTHNPFCWGFCSPSCDGTMVSISVFNPLTY